MTISPGPSPRYQRATFRRCRGGPGSGPLFTSPMLLIACAIAAVLGAGGDASANKTIAVPRLRRMVVIGDSLLAGFSNGGLVARGLCGQRNGASVLIARQGGASLPQPTMSRPGV